MKAALFDLDGTLLDSNRVWARVDELFFAARGLEIPADYARAISGMSFFSTAAYTKERFALPETADEIVREWTEMTARTYAEHVALKPGSAEFLRALKARGVRLAVVTSLHRALYAPCLARHTLLDLFDLCLSTDEAGGKSKADGHLYRMAADRLGVPYPDCAVFEDVYEGILGAKSIGMRAFCVVDSKYTHHLDEIREIADGVGESVGVAWRNGDVARSSAPGPRSREDLP